MKILHVITILVLGTTYFSNFANYIFCIDGGGSKTALQVIDMQGNILELVQHDVSTDTIKSTGSNINSVGIDGTRHALEKLFSDVRLKDSNIPLYEILPSSYVISRNGRHWMA